MLQELRIQNLALIEKLELLFQPGFTTLTGETGAGKSILLDALGLALGERADSGLVRHGTPKADVIAQFEVAQLPHVMSWLEEQELEEETQCLMRRTVTAEGRSKAYINGYPATANQLKTLGAMLIDIHGQHEHQNLLSANQQIHLLDAYANHAHLLADTKLSYQHWQQLQKQLHQLEEEQADFQSRLELLSFQKNEFDELKPSEGEFESLSEEQNQLSHANEIKQACEQAYAHLEEEQGAVDAINNAIHALSEIVDFNPSLQTTIEQLNSSLIEIQEAASEVHRTAEHIELDPEQLNEVEERLAKLFGMAKKYNLEAEELVDKHQQIFSELERLENSDESLEQLKQEVKSAAKDFEGKASKLTQSRQKAATKLAKIVTQGMQTLGMENGQFDIRITQNESVNALGQDRVQFLVTANKGQPLQPLSKVASGGELSRISLAIQVATSEVASLPTMIFDEVDVGIGGGIAEVVGEKMQQLGASKQIFSITHLPQVASHGHQHLFIQKQTKGNVTRTAVTALNDRERVEELARMLGGKELTEQTRTHAKEMLQTAQAK